jgi:hypothetical protein
MSKRKDRASMQNPMAGEFAPPVERQFYSVACLCGLLQQPPEFIHRMMRAANIEFAWTENGVGVIRGDDVQRMAAMLEQAREVVEKSEAAPNN